MGSEDTAGREVLSPVVAWGMFTRPAGLSPRPPHRPEQVHDPTRLPAQRRPGAGAGGCDRRLRRWNGGRRGRWLAPTLGPLTVFNAAVTKRAWLPTGRRVLVSRAALAPSGGCPPTEVEPAVQAIDGHDLLDTRDIPLVTAAMLSARFPVVEPSARVGMSPDVSDGGGCEAREIEAGGAEAERRRPLREHGAAYDHAAPAEHPTVDRSLDGRGCCRARRNRRPADSRSRSMTTSSSLRGNEQGAESGTLRHVLVRRQRGGRAQRARAQAAIMHGIPGVTFRRISPSPHVGAQAATGWEIPRTRGARIWGRPCDPGPTQGTTAAKEIREMLDGTRMPSLHPAPTPALTRPSRPGSHP